MVGGRRTNTRAILDAASVDRCSNCGHLKECIDGVCDGCNQKHCDSIDATADEDERCGECGEWCVGDCTPDGCPWCFSPACAGDCWVTR